MQEPNHRRRQNRIEIKKMNTNGGGGGKLEKHSKQNR